MLTIHCPRCNTALALDPAQLTASQGWARCGHCQHVFDAGQLSLPTLDPKSKPAPTSDASAPLSVASAAPSPPASAPPAHFDWSHIDLGLPSSASAAPSTSSLNLASTAESTEEADSGAGRHADAVTVEPAWLDLHANEAHAQAPDTNDPQWLDDQAPLGTDDLPRPEADPLFAGNTTASATSTLFDSTASASPSDALSSSTPQLGRGRARKTLLALSLILILVLLAQVIHLQRNWLGARWPQSRPWLEQACGLLGCQVQSLRDLRWLQVSQSAVVRLPNQRFQMDLEVRNDGTTQVATPQLELSLQDPQGQTWARRVMPLQIDGSPAELRAHQRYSAQISWRTDESDAQRLEAYQVRLVYTELSSPSSNQGH